MYVAVDANHCYLENSVDCGTQMLDYSFTASADPWTLENQFEQM